MDDVALGLVIGDLDGTPTDDPGKVSGLFDGALHFNGISQWLSYGSQTDGTCAMDMDLCPGYFTLAMWVQFFGQGIVITNGGGAGASKGFMVSLVGQGLKATVRTTRQWLTTPSPVAFGDWTYIVLAWSDTDGLSLYVDGCVASHADAEPRSAVYNPSSDQHFVIATASGANSAGTNLINMDIDDVRMWYGGLTSNQIWYMYLQTVYG